MNERATSEPASEKLTTQLNFESHIQAEKPAVVAFYADWSAPCKLMVPVLYEVKETAGDRAEVISIDINKDKAYAEEYAVYTVPTLIIFKKGIAVWRKNGISSAREILRHLDLLMN